MENKELAGVFNRFIDCKVKDISPLGKGNINYTYKVVCENGEEYLLQRLNSNALPNIEGCLNNIEVITEHIKSKGEVSLSLIKTIDGERSYNGEGGFVWRLYPFFAGTTSVNECDDLTLIEELARGFGNFDNNLIDLDMSKAVVSDDNFHNTRQKYEMLQNTIKLDRMGRVKTAIETIQWAEDIVKKFKKVVSKNIFALADALFSNKLPMQVVHNDTKLNNALLTKENKVLCIVDLDTAMPGTILNDFGDGVRFACNNASEEEYNIEKVSFNIDRFEAFTKGFFSGYKRKLTKKEKSLVALSPISIAFELGCRFLADYLNGDVFFKIVSNDKCFNLVRARVQFALAESMLDNYMRMNEIVLKYMV